MRIGGRARVWVALVGVLVALGVPAEAATKRGELVLRGVSGGMTASLPAGVRLDVRDGFLPAPSGNIRGVVIREASTGALVLASVSMAVPASERVTFFQRGQGYESGRLSGRFRITLLGDKKGAPDVVLPVEGISGRKVLNLNGGAYLKGVGVGDPAGAQSSYRAGMLEIFHSMGFIWAWSVKRGAGLHRVQFCVAPEGGDCLPDSPVTLNTGPTTHSGAHFSAPATRPPGKYDLVLDITSAGATGPVGMVGYLFI